MTVLCSAALILVASPALGASKPAPPRAESKGAVRFLSRDKPVHVTAQRLSVLTKAGRAIFTGKVVARQGDLTLRCDKLVARNDPKGGLSSLVATGRIRLRKAHRRASGKRLEYDHKKRVMVLTGSPKLWERDNLLEGRRVLFFLDQDRVEVEGARGHLRFRERK